MLESTSILTLEISGRLLLRFQSRNGVTQKDPLRYNGSMSWWEKYNQSTVWWVRALVLVGVVGVSYAFFTPFCGVMFNCGCKVLWDGAGNFCNVHNLGGPHCPFCSTGSWGKMLPRGSVWVTQAAVVLAPLNISWKSSLLLGLMAFIGTALLIGLVFLLTTGYPTFLGIGV